jgi:hypothetical protein
VCKMVPKFPEFRNWRLSDCGARGERNARVDPGTASLTRVATAMCISPRVRLRMNSKSQRHWPIMTRVTQTLVDTIIVHIPQYIFDHT